MEHAINRRLLAGLCATAALAGGLAVGPTAMAANTGLVLKASIGNTLAGHAFTAYRLGEYTDVQETSGVVRSLNVVGDSQSNRWVQAAIDAYNAAMDGTADDITVPAGYDAAGAVAKLEDGKDAKKLRGITRYLADTGSKPSAAATVNGSGTQITLNVPDGLYLVVDSAGNPMLVGTKANGMDMKSTKLGEYYVKATAITTDKKTMSPDGDYLDETTATVGTVITNQVKVTIPNNRNGGAVTLKMTDTPTGMTYVKGSLRATVDGADATSSLTVYDTAGATVRGDATYVDKTGKRVDPDLTVPQGGFIIDAKNALSKYANKQMTITYRMTVTAASASKPAGNEFASSGVFADGPWWSSVDADDTVPVKAYSFDLHKTNQSDTSQSVSGAGFKIRDERSGKWLTLDWKTGMWSRAAGQEQATEFLTGDTNHDNQVTSADSADRQGDVTFPGLGEGTYLVKETRAPEGFKSDAIALPSFTVTISPEGAITFRGRDLPALTTDDGDGTVTVADIQSLLQLPATGGAWTIASFLAAAALVAGLAGGIAVRARRERRDADKPIIVA